MDSSNKPHKGDNILRDSCYFRPETTDYFLYCPFFKGHGFTPYFLKMQLNKLNFKPVNVYLLENCFKGDR